MSHLYASCQLCPFFLAVLGPDLRVFWVIVWIWKHWELFLRWWECKVLVQVGCVVTESGTLIHRGKEGLVEIKEVLPVVDVGHLERLAYATRFETIQKLTMTTCC